MLKKIHGNIKVQHGVGLPMRARDAIEEMGKLCIDAGIFPEGISKTQMKRLKRVRKQSRGID